MVYDIEQSLALYKLKSPYYPTKVGEVYVS